VPKIPGQLSRSPSREYREATQLATAREHRHVAALRANAKTRRHAQTRPGRVVLLRSSAQGTPRGVERTSTWLLAGWETHYGNQRAVLPSENKPGQSLGDALGDGGARSGISRHRRSPGPPPRSPQVILRGQRCNWELDKMGRYRVPAASEGWTKGLALALLLGSPQVVLRG
jgi:hypothetical protein